MTNLNNLTFVFIGGEHQVLHLAPVAAELSLSHPDITVRCICADDRTAAALRAVAAAMRASTMTVTQIAWPWAGRIAARITGSRSAAKGPLLARIRWQARKTQAIIVPERTSAALRWLGWKRPLVHFRHGAGDRAPSTEAKQRAFDAIFVPGQKDIERAVAQGLSRKRLSAVGYIKIDYLQALPTGPRLFDNDRPTVFYNPHFDPALSSIGIARDVIARFRQQERYNLVFAPHVRAFENLDPIARARWLELAVPEHIAVDLDSPKLFDMSYARAADIYLGDMSRQLYEFLAKPRPVAFVNAHGANWQDDPRYAGWHLGEVASGADDVLAAVDRAFERHPDMIQRQAKATAFAFGRYDGAIKRASYQLLHTLQSL
ncbi:hypothetical protein [Croceicoccus marinus]|uniref:Glycosyl transferase n=1 Tax=Croceicoccus marinus TaxID=450378 RepID=A0A7G6VYW9_9SPHN|nr:hypothetical protein [Croceicoccus marinus]QNE06934.1 hypothetical protein H4O24_17930 [Croceicoccus marinus]